MNLTSELILKLKDDVSAKAKPIQAALDGIAKGEKAVGAASADMKKLVAELDKLKNTSKVVDAFKQQAKAVTETRTAFALAKENVKRMAVELAAADKPTRAMTAAFKAAQREVKTASEAFKAQAAATSQARSAMAGFDISISHVASAEGRLRASIEKTTQAIRQQGEADQRLAARAKQSAERQAAIRSTLGTVGMIAGPAILGAATGAVHQGADMEQLKTRLLNVSNSPSEVEKAVQIALGANKKNPYSTVNQSLEDYGELRSLAVTEGGGVDIDRLRKGVETMAKTRAALAASGYSMSEEDAKAMAVAIEGSGRARDPQAQEKMAEAFVRAKQVFGNAINASMIRDFVANAKASNFSATDDSFYYTTFARLAQGNASRLGNEAAQTLNTLVGGKMTKQSASWLVDLGLINRNQIVDQKGGKFSIKGDIANQSVLSTDQTTWAQTTLLNAIEKHGDLSEGKIAARVDVLRRAELAKNPNAQLDDRVLRERAEHGLVSDSLMKSGFRSTVIDNLAHAIANAFQTSKDVEQMHNATGLAAANNIGKNPIAALQELTSSVQTFGAVLSSPIMGKVGDTLDRMAGGVTSMSQALAKFSADHPAIAEIGSAGVLGLTAYKGAKMTYGLLDGFASGFGLKGSAAALTSAAAALDGAAARMGGPAGMIPGGPGKRPSAKARVPWGRAAVHGVTLIDPISRMMDIKTEADADAMLKRSQGSDRSWNDWLIQNVPGMKYLDGQWRDENLDAHAIRRPGPMSADRIPDIQPGGQDAGVQTGQNIADGLASQESSITAAAERIMAAITAALSKGVDVPIRLQQQGASTVTGTHSDYGIDYTYGD